jgi:hypothetical protein
MYLHRFDAELVDKSIGDLKHGTAADLDKITAEHLQNCLPKLSTVLHELFNFIVKTAHWPASFCHSYTVPLIKINYSRLIQFKFMIGSVIFLSQLKINEVSKKCRTHSCNIYGMSTKKCKGTDD